MDQDQKAVCGAALCAPRWLWMTDSPLCAENRLRAKEMFAGCATCVDCRLAEWAGSYVYAMVPGK
jgi:hypothetical protein